MNGKSPTKEIRTYLAALGVIGLFVGIAVFLPQAFATHQPANKAAVSAGSIEILSTEVTEGAVSEEVALLSTTVRSNNPADLVLSVTLECALWTELLVVGNDNPSEAVASVKVWIEIDNTTLPVSGDDTADPGKVVFCNRAYGMTLSQFDDNEDDHNVETFLRTRAANAFNWFEINMGSGEHTITVKAQLEAEVNGQGLAKAGIGKRTLLVDPIKLANDITI